MIIELRKKSQITIPKKIVHQLNLQENDQLEISIQDGIILIEPVAVYPKSYIQKLEETVLKFKKDSSKYSVGSVKSVKEAINELEAIKEEDNKDKGL